jgi:hypothetical protein
MWMVTAEEVATVAVVSPADIEAQFQNALRLIDVGQAELAVPILRRLYAETTAPRVRLELARSLLLAGKQEEARRLFVEAYQDSPPSVVRATVLSFIDKIDQRKGKFSVSGSIARYNNPLQQPGTSTLNFGGIELTYEPDEKYRNRLGATAGLNYSKDFMSGVQLSTALAYRDLPGDIADRFTADISLTRQVGKAVELTLGVSRLDQNGLSFTLPFTQAAFLVPLAKHMALKPTVTVAYRASDLGSFNSGWQADAFYGVVFSPKPTKYLAVGPTIQRQSSGFAEQAYTAVGFRTIAMLHGEKLNVEVGVQGSAMWFDGVSPFWGLRRMDKGVFASVLASSHYLRLGPLMPAVGVSCSYSNSNIDYYRQRGCDVLFEVRRLF